MNDRDVPNDGPAFDDPAFDEVRSMLADVRDAGPMPAEVAARLDATLADLQRERRADLAPVVPLLRRRVGRVLVAAAAIVVIGSGGVGIAQLARSGAGDDNAATSSAGGSAADSLSGKEPEANAPSVPAPATARAERGNRVPRLTTASFAGDAARVMRTVDRLTANSFDGSTGGTPGADTDTAAPKSGLSALEAPALTQGTDVPDGLFGRDQRACPGPDAPGAVTLTATLDGALVALVFRPPADAAQQVEAWSCDGSALLASASVPTS